MSEETKKPSERVTGRVKALVKLDCEMGCPTMSLQADHIAQVVALLGGNPTDTEFDILRDGKTIEARRYGFLFLALTEHLDTEAERRTVWEAKIEAELAARPATPPTTTHPGLLAALVAALHADSRDACQAQVAAILDTLRAATEAPVKP